ncbi:MAG: hypothetical protein ACREO0_07355 [Pseudoxanthomonas sp.]
MKFIVFAALAIFAGQVSAAPTLEYAEVKALADKDEASLAPPASQGLLKSQGELLEAGAAACATPTPDLSPFVVVMELDAQGTVVRTWLQGSSLIGICIRNYVSGKTLIVPPRTPFYTSLELTFSK